CALLDQAFDRRPELAERFPACRRAAGASCEESIEFVTDRPGHDRRYGIDSSRIGRDLRFTPRVEFEQGLRATVDWYIDNVSWWAAILDGSYRRLTDLPRSGD